jgi:uncharacterized protein
MMVRGNDRSLRRESLQLGKSEWPMRVLYTSDTHVYPSYFDRLLRAAEVIRPGAVIIGGDIIPAWQRGIQASIEPHKDWVRTNLIPRLEAFRDKCGDTQVLLDLGNDDIAAARFLLEEQDGKSLTLLHMRLLRLDEDTAVAGYMKVNPTPFLIKDGEKCDCRDYDGLRDYGVRKAGSVTISGRETPYTLDCVDGSIEDDMDKLWQEIESAAWSNFSIIFVSHAPPKNTDLDATSSGHHVGSLAIRRFIENSRAGGRLIASLHGHIHESPWRTGRVWQYLGSTPCFNVGQKAQFLRALLLDTEEVVSSARLVLIGRAGEFSIREEEEWFPEG